MTERFHLGMRGVLALNWPDELRGRRGGLGNHAVVLATIADHADDDGYAWPRMDTIAAMVGASPDTVYRIVDDLCQAELLDRVRLAVKANGNHASYLYRLPGAHPLEPDEIRTPNGFRFAEPPPASWSTDEDPAPAPGPGPGTDVGSGDLAPASGQEVPNGEVPNDEGPNASPAAADAAAEPPWPGVASDETVAQARRLCRLFAAYVKRNGHAIPTTQTAVDGWLLEMEKLVRIGPPGDVPWPDDPDDAAAEIERVMLWALDASDFWPANVQSVGTFRSKFTRLRGQADRSNGRRGRTPTGDEYRAAAARLREMGDG